MKRKLVIALGSVLLVVLVIVLSRWLGVNIPIPVDDWLIDLKDWSYEVVDNTVVIKGYLGEQINVVIPETIQDTKVVKIADEAFAHSDLESITMPDSVTEIGKNAFAGCDNLKLVHLSEKLGRLENGIFSNCTALKEIEIPESVKYIGINVFSGCTNLRFVTMSDDLHDKMVNGTILVFSDKQPHISLVFSDSPDVEINGSTIK